MKVQSERLGVQTKLLWSIFLINFIFYFVEMTTGLISKSMGIVVDSFIYGISFHAESATVARKKKVARLAGYFQIALASIGFIEVIRRVIGTVVFFIVIRGTAHF